MIELYFYINHEDFPVLSNKLNNIRNKFAYTLGNNKWRKVLMFVM